MTPTIQEGGALLLAQVNGNASDVAIAERAWSTASALVANFVRSSVVPEEVTTEAILQCGSEIWHRRQAPNGIQQFATPDGTSAIRVARDPMLAAYPLLIPYVGLGISG